MKQLLLCRHAKSSWKNPSLPDFKRPLNKRGKRDAPVMGKRLTLRMMIPDAILCSPATRAKKTAALLCKGMGCSPKIITYKSGIYDTTVKGLLKVIRSASDKVDRVMLVGHNFELTDLVNDLLAIDLYNVPTCGIVACSLDMDYWQDIDKAHAELLFFDYPKKEGL